MKGINLSPLNLCMIFLLILIIVVYYNRFQTHEGMKGGNSDVVKELYVPYNETRALVLLHTVGHSGDSNTKVYYDEMYGNVVVAPVQTDKDDNIEFQVVSRSGKANKHTSDNGKPPTSLKSDMANTSSIKQLSTDSSGKPHNFSWSYGEKGLGIMYVKGLSLDPNPPHIMT